jgi:hypothetical protein
MAVRVRTDLNEATVQATLKLRRGFLEEAASRLTQDNLVDVNSSGADLGQV